MRRSFFLLLAALPLLLGCPRSRDGLALITVHLGDQRLRTEVAQKADEQMRGLMYRRDLPERAAMLFVYPNERTLSFWMKNTYIPLSIAYLDGQGVIVDIQDMAPHDTRPHPSKAPARFALEVNQGWFARHGVAVGAQARFELPDGTRFPP